MNAEVYFLCASRKRQEGSINTASSYSSLATSFSFNYTCFLFWIFRYLFENIYWHYSFVPRSLMKHSWLGSFQPCLISISLLHFKHETSDVNHLKIPIFSLFFLYKRLSLQISCHISVFMGMLGWIFWIFFGDAKHSFLLLSSPHKVLYYSSFFPTSDRNL